MAETEIGAPERLAEVRFSLAGTWRAIQVRLTEPGVAMIAVDMPIGLAESGQRACEPAARKLLPAGRKSSVFTPPRRYMRDCRDWAEANARGKATEGKGLSHQAWNIAHKIFEIDACLAPAEQDRIIEAHPELIFHRRNGGPPLTEQEDLGGTRGPPVSAPCERLGGLGPLVCALSPQPSRPRRLSGCRRLPDAGAGPLGRTRPPPA